jgi:hypothetical protein
LPLSDVAPPRMSLITSFDYRAAYGQARLLDRQKALKWDTPDDSRTGLDGSDFLDCLEWGRLGRADDLRADLDQLFLQARQRTSPGSAPAPPACRKFAEVVAECVKLELHGVGSERAACQPRPLDRAFADKSGRRFRSPLSMEGVDCCGFLPDCLDPYAIEHGDEGELGFGYRGFGFEYAG